MKTLFAKLVIALLGIVALAGTGFYVLERYSTGAYYEELTQRLNAPIAMYVTGEKTLIENGSVNEAALKTLAHQAMIINPTVEVYLLDAEGRVLAHGLPPESVKAPAVDLGPVRRLLSGDAAMPLKTTDPRDPTKSKIFSAAEIRSGNDLEGYLYAVLGGQKYDELAGDIRGSYVQKLSIGAIALIGLCAFLVGILVFGVLTRRLRTLTTDVQRYAASDFDPGIGVGHSSGTGDEIDRLGEAFTGMADRISEQFQQLRETDKLRRELISNVSHDLRTPLAAMQGYVDTLLIRNESLSVEERQRYLQVTRAHTRRLGRLIGDLFELSKLESASVTPEFESFSLAELLHDIAQEFELEAREKGVTIKVSSAAQSSMVTADIGLIQRVLENLLKNALKYTPNGGSITLTVNRAKSGVAVAVSDTGCGIPPGELPRIFDRFYRAEGGEKSGASSGLGLAIVKRILELHNGSITVTSEIDRGSCFEFDLPERPAA